MRSCGANGRNRHDFVIDDNENDVMNLAACSMWICLMSITLSEGMLRDSNIVGKTTIWTKAIAYQCSLVLLFGL